MKCQSADVCWCILIRLLYIQHLYINCQHVKLIQSCETTKVSLFCPVRSLPNVMLTGRGCGTSVNFQETSFILFMTCSLCVRVCLCLPLHSLLAIVESHKSLHQHRKTENLLNTLQTCRLLLFLLNKLHTDQMDFLIWWELKWFCVCVPKMCKCTQNRQKEEVNVKLKQRQLRIDQTQGQATDRLKLFSWSITYFLHLDHFDNEAPACCDLLLIRWDLMTFVLL